MRVRIRKAKISNKAYTQAAFERLSREDLEAAGVKLRSVEVDARGREAPAPQVRRVQAGVGFCCLRNWPAITERMAGDRTRFGECLNDFIESVSDIVVDLGGSVQRFKGGGILYCCESRAREADGTTNAVLAALKIRYRMNKLNRRWDCYREDAWAVATGVHTGMVVLEQTTAEGKTELSIRGAVAHLAWGIGTVTGGSKVFISEAVYRDARFDTQLFVCEKPFHLQPREFEDVQRVHEVVGMAKP